VTASDSAGAQGLCLIGCHMA